MRRKGVGKVALTLGSLYFSRRQTLRVALSAFLCKKSASRSILWIRNVLTTRYHVLVYLSIFLILCNTVHTNLVIFML